MKTEVTEIDMFLDNHGFGYLLNYLNNRKRGDDPYMLPAVDVLRMVPEFEKKICAIRDRFHINCEENIKMVEIQIGKEKLNRYFQDLVKIIWMKDLPINSNFISVKNSLKVFGDKYYQKLSDEINKINRDLTINIQPTWYQDIEIYILFNICGYTPFVFRKPSPEINMHIDKKTKEKYVELKIFSDTNLKFINGKSRRDIFSRYFPNYINQDKVDSENNLRRFLHYILRVNGKFSHGKIYEWLEEAGFNVGEYSYASQEVKRFRDMVGMKK